ncbi:hypothetical protein Ahy_A05g023986 isoform A [Arachis hypogaea]|uniref:Ubiquitin-like protease family profile domain-containing protein n=1 Tax=Arachis hypogaea TaxID=3818 RepID=A0A445D500_ARAHY|nr:hypothetical protein Ahy_A05g023986 isoform A [Arachis hypogaea]
MTVMRMETHSQPEVLSIVPIQVYFPLSQTTPVPAIEPSLAKSPREKISEERTKSTPQPPKPDENTPMIPPAPSKINPAPEDTVARMMMARTASYIPKEGSMPPFSLSLTDSSQEEALTQEGQGQPGAQKAKSPKTPKLIEQLEELVKKITNSGVKTALDYAEGKSPPIEKQCAEEIFEKFETPVKSKEISAEMKEKCYVWTTRVKTYGDGNTNEYDPVCTIKAQDRFILSKVHFASLKAATHIEAENMAIGNHPNGEFLQPKSKKPFRVEDYPMFIPFLDLKKLASHRYGYVISRMRGEPLRKKDHEIEPPYINISGQKTSYDCAIYVMKWLEIILPENIKRGKCEWNNWTQEEVDHFRV